MKVINIENYNYDRQNGKKGQREIEVRRMKYETRTELYWSCETKNSTSLQNDAK